MAARYCLGAARNGAEFHASGQVSLGHGHLKTVALILRPLRDSHLPGDDTGVTAHLARHTVDGPDCCRGSRRYSRARFEPPIPPSDDMSFRHRRGRPSRGRCAVVSAIPVTDPPIPPTSCNTRLLPPILVY